MPKVPYKQEKPCDDDEDYEIVSFEDFCDKSPGSKTDLLTLNDNINYRLYYEGNKASKNNEYTTSQDLGHTETSLNGPKTGASKKTIGKTTFTPTDKYNGKQGKGSLFGGVLPKQRNEGESSSREHRYQRFSDRRTLTGRICDNLPGVGSGMLMVTLVCALCVGAWWVVCGALDGRWGEEHYKRLWERAHPDTIKQPLVPVSYDQVPIENRYHDHNNLSTKNKVNTTEMKKPDFDKKSFTESLDAMDTCSNVTVNMRFDCYPQDGASEPECSKRGCCWKSDVPNVPYCFYPLHYDTFRFINMTENKHGVTIYYEKNRPSGYPGDFNMARLDFRYLSNDVLQIKISDAENKRFEPPFPEIPMVPGSISDKKYRVEFEMSSVGFKIVRTADNVTIINTQGIGGLVLSDKFLQMSAVLPTNQLYGLGEKRSRFMMDLNQWQTFTMFNTDIVPKENYSLYGTQPFYLALEKNGNSHGMVLLNSNAIDVVLQPAPAITYRTIGGVLNFFVMMGPSPKEVVTQYVTLIGKPFMPPYWALGFHLCKFNYGSLNVTQQVWQQNRDAGIPFDVQWNDLDYMNNSNDFSYDTKNFAGLPEFVDKLHKEGMHYMVLIDPGISAAEPRGEYPPFDRGLEMDIFVKNSSGQPFVGKVWNKVSTVYPDFTHPSGTSYWVDMMTAFHDQVPYDGAWIDMNEPSNFVSGSIYGTCAPEGLPYRPRMLGGDGLRTKTLCMEAAHHAGPHYDVHNLYALTEAIATHFALTEIRGKRPFIISRSSFVGLGRYAGHWSGDIDSQWHDMKMTIPELLSFSLFGVPMMGADICGFRGNTTPELCTRWMQLGAFYPFSRNHNSDTSAPQDPVSLGAGVVSASRAALRLRYSLLPVYYTLLWRAHTRADTLVRPLFFEFPEETITHPIDDQFMIGPHLMVTPILEQGAAAARAYFPGPERWYNVIDGAYLQTNGWQHVYENQTVSIKGGAVIPRQEAPARGPVSTSSTRGAALQLLVVPDSARAAHGDLYWDDGDSINSFEEKKYSYIEFTLKNTELRSIVRWWGYGVPSLNNVTVLDQPPVGTVTVNDAPAQFVYTPHKVLQIHNLNLPLDTGFSIKWSYKHTVTPNAHVNSVRHLNNTVSSQAFGMI